MTLVKAIASFLLHWFDRFISLPDENIPASAFRHSIDRVRVLHDKWQLRWRIEAERFGAQALA